MCVCRVTVLRWARYSGNSRGKIPERMRNHINCVYRRVILGGLLAPSTALADAILYIVLCLMVTCGCCMTDRLMVRFVR